MKATSVTVIIIMVFVQIQAKGYCDICKNHTMCIYPETGLRCYQEVVYSIHDDAIKAHIVEQHNKLRNVVALGQETRGAPGPQPPAANLKKMTWDDELAAVAQRWSNQCIFEHDSCRDVDRFVVGQNLFCWSSKYRNGKLLTNETLESQRTAWTRAVTAWYDEVAKFDPRHIKPFHFSPDTGHYTALLWADTHHVGCGFVSFLDPGQDGWYTKHFVCNYGPAGNRLGAALYQVGAAGTGCEQQDTAYRALCA
ncbi:venom allergen 3 [Cryptotermes secundus]|uniref:venom allergen 3 n=1 Tax=Cryptotermes secundus TaxID=105785 RepID=UPI000CD7B08F|nr:venom allergen 3 [Cryptotermes secundus]XP_023715532.1 venom allergen 3 [Cryptotermes secundus]